MNRNKLTTVTYSIPRYKREYSFSVSDTSTWKELLDNFVDMLQLPGGYVISRDGLMEWVEESEYIRSREELKYD